MKIAFVGSTLFGRGAEFALAAVAKGLSLRGHSVDVVVTKYHSMFAEAHPEIRPFDIGRSRLLVTPHCRGRYSILSLRRFFRKGQYDIVVCQSAPMALPVVIASWGLKVKTVYVEHSGCVGVDSHGRLKRVGEGLLKAICNRLMRRFSAQFAVSHGTASDIHRMTGFPQERIRVVYNPVFETIPEKIPSSDINHGLVIAAGALTELKHFDLLLEAFALVRKTRPCSLVIYGEGPLREALEHQAEELGISDVVKFPGFVNDLQSRLGRAACFVLSSHVESFGISLVEALAAGVPVVSVDCPYGPREVLQEGEFGILVPQDDAEALARGISRVLDGDGITPKIEMVSRYSLAAIAEAYERELVKI